MSIRGAERYGLLSGGTTIEAVRVLEEKGFRSAVIEAITQCMENQRN